MAWTSPMTWTANSVLTAAQLNTHLRDNLMETEVAKATLAGQYFTGSSNPHRIETRKVATARVGTSESFAKTEWDDLATVGPAVTVTTGKRALVFIAAQIQANALGRQAAMSWGLTGATEREPLTLTQLLVDGLTASNAFRMSNFDFIDNLTPGSNTFTAKYRVLVESTTGTFSNRFIAVMPF